MTESTDRLASIVRLIDDVLTERPLPAIPVPFAMQGDPRIERIIALSEFDLAAYVATSDGSYDKSRGLFLGTGKIGLALTAGVMAGQAVRNSRRKKAARKAMTPRWIVGEGGTLAVSQLGFYLASHSGIHYWGWGAIDYCTILGPRQIELVGQSAKGPVRWQLTSEAAELVFFLWAIVRAPHHPQLDTPAWQISAHAAHATMRGQLPGSR